MKKTIGLLLLVASGAFLSLNTANARRTQNRISCLLATITKAG